MKLSRLLKETPLWTAMVKVCDTCEENVAVTGVSRSLTTIRDSEGRNVSFAEMTYSGMPYTPTAEGTHPGQGIWTTLMAVSATAAVGTIAAAGPVMANARAMTRTVLRRCIFPPLGTVETTDK